jgi:hypothetical protein
VARALMKSEHVNLRRRWGMAGAKAKPICRFITKSQPHKWPLVR